MANALTHAQLEQLHQRLHAERTRILLVLRTTDEAAPQVDQVTEVEESAQRATERTHDLELEARERPLLAEVDHALKKLEDGKYGVSEVSGEPIPYQRLVAIPWARLAVDE
jgi:DnaK suppressor protein